MLPIDISWLTGFSNWDSWREIKNIFPQVLENLKCYFFWGILIRRGKFTFISHKSFQNNSSTTPCDTLIALLQLITLVKYYANVLQNPAEKGEKLSWFWKLTGMSKVWYHIPTNRRLQLDWLKNLVYIILLVSAHVYLLFGLPLNSIYLT